MNPKTLKIGKKLSLIKLLMSGKSISLDTLAEIAGYHSINDLKKELGELFMVGSYPYTPADLMEVNYDGNSVSLSVPVSVDKSVRLNTKEWLALNEILEEDLNAPEFADNCALIDKILTRIKKIIPKSAFITWGKNTSVLEDAIRQKKRVRFHYSSRKNDEKIRKVEPLMIFHDKTDYLIGWCLDANASRMFRIESIHNVKLTEETFHSKHPAEDTIQSFKKLIHHSNKDMVAELIVTETAFFNLSRQLNLKIMQKNARLMGKPALLVTAPILEEDWFTDLISRFGRSVQIIRPESIRNRIINQLHSFRLPDRLAP